MEHEASALLANPVAACVGTHPPAPFLGGECIIRVNGIEIDGPHALGRALQPSPNASLGLVQTDEKSRRIDYVFPAR